MRMESLFLNSHVKMFEEKTPLSHKVVCFQMLDFRTSKSNSEVSNLNANILVENYIFFEKYDSS